jgi:hypothetical protein
LFVLFFIFVQAVNKGAPSRAALWPLPINNNNTGTSTTDNGRWNTRDTKQKEGNEFIIFTQFFIFE